MAEEKKNELAGLMEYVQASCDDLEELKTAATPQAKTDLVYNIYANLCNLQEECKCICREMRKKWHVKDTDIKKWMREIEAREAQEESESPAGAE